MTDQPVVPFPSHSFAAHGLLLRIFLTHRTEIVDRIEAILNAQRKPIGYLQDLSLLSRHFEDCFFAANWVTSGQAALRDQLEAAHWAAGFRPRLVQHVHNDLIHPAEMMIRGFHLWQQTRWPGHNGRLHYAHTLFNLYMIRRLQFLSMRIWDEEENGDESSLSSIRLAEIQSLLDELWTTSPADQPVIVRDARWLIPLAQSLITDQLEPYFRIAHQITHSLPQADALEIQKAHVRMLGGHLTSQIRHYCVRDRVSIDEPSLVSGTRTANALDLALLVQGLAALLKAYDRALQSGDDRTRLDLAGAIFQGISPDPQLFLNRLDLLNAHTMIEHVFITPEATQEARESHVVYSPLGLRHVQLLQEYAALMDRLIPSLRDDWPRFRPVNGGYSPYGVLFGLPSNLVEHMALKTLRRDAETRFSLEDVFRDNVFRDDVLRNGVSDDGDRSAAKLAWVKGWRQLPHIDPDVQRLYDYPQQFAEAIYNRIGHEFSQRDFSTGHLCIRSGADHEVSAIPEVSARYFASSDKQIVAAQKAELCDQAQLLRDRQEGHFLVSYETSGGWMALRKSLLSEVLGTGHDARIVGLPRIPAQVLQLMCTNLLNPSNRTDP